ncbi:hypothetical protein ACET9P_22100 [Aeromonas veronii]
MKSLLFEIGLDKPWIDRHLSSFMEQKNSRRPSLLPFFMKGVPLEIGNRLSQIQSQYEAETGRSAYRPYDMWSHYFDKMSIDVANYVALNIDFKVKMMGKAPWVQEGERSVTTRIHTGYDIVKTRTGSVFWNKTENIEADRWVLSGDGLEYSVLLGASILDMLDLSKMSLGDYISTNIKNSSPVFSYMNKNRSDDCLASTRPPSDIITNCESKYVTRTSKVTSDHEALSAVLNAYLLHKKSDFKTIKTNEVFFEVLKGMLPLWGTVEDIKAGNNFMATLGIIGDAMFFIPFIDDVSDTARFTIKAVKGNKFATSAKFTQTPIVLGSGSDTLVVGGRVDRAFYAKKAAQSALKIPLRVIDEINPLSFGGIDGLFSMGRVDIPYTPNFNRFTPDLKLDVQEFLDAKFNEKIVTITELPNDIFLINGEVRAIKIGEDYYFINATLPLGEYHIVDEFGNNRFPITNVNGKWEVDFSKEIDNPNLVGMNVVPDGYGNPSQMMNGIYKIEDKLAINVNDIFYEVQWDPVYGSWYVFDEHWNRKFISGEYNGKWFENSSINSCWVN